MLFLSEGRNRVISCYINSERQIKLNNYTEKDNNQQNPWLKKKTKQRKQSVFSTHCPDMLTLPGALLSQRERWQIHLIIPQKAARVDVDEEQSAARGHPGSRVEDGTVKVLWLSFYVLLTRCECTLSSQRWCVPAALYKGAGWQQSEQDAPTCTRPCSLAASPRKSVGEGHKCRSSRSIPATWPELISSV